MNRLSLYVSLSIATDNYTIPYMKQVTFISLFHFFIISCLTQPTGSTHVLHNCIIELHFPAFVAHVCLGVVVDVVVDVVVGVVVDVDRRDLELSLQHREQYRLTCVCLSRLTGFVPIRESWNKQQDFSESYNDYQQIVNMFDIL